MCTIALLPGSPGHLLLASNRDELRTRARALLPDGPVDLGATRALFPVDADAGGTWVGGNACGVLMTLLNNYQAAAHHAPAAAPISRGVLVRELLACQTVEAARRDLERWQRTDRLARTRPFVLAIACAQQPTRALVCAWSGQRLTMRPQKLPLLLVSSSVGLPEATRRRLRALRPLMRVTRWDEDPRFADPNAALELFAQCGPAPAPWAVCMERPDARTVSHTLLTTTPEELTMTYLDGPPGAGPRAHHPSPRARLSAPLLTLI